MLGGDGRTVPGLELQACGLTAHGLSAAQGSAPLRWRGACAGAGVVSGPVPLQPPALQPPVLRLPPGLALTVAEAAANHRALHPVLGPHQPARPQRGRGPEERVQLRRWVPACWDSGLPITCLCLRPFLLSPHYFLSPPDITISLTPPPLLLHHLLLLPITSLLHPSRPVLLSSPVPTHLPSCPPVASCSQPLPLSPLYTSSLCSFFPPAQPMLSSCPPFLPSFVVPFCPTYFPSSHCYLFPPVIASPLLPWETFESAHLASA